MLSEPAIQESSSAMISRAPVRYNLPSAPPELPVSEAELEAALEHDEDDDNEVDSANDAPRSLRPGQKGFAERLMSKYGWTKGSGLGADGSGIVNPLRVKVEKRRRKPDSEGGGFVDPGGRGKIIGGERKDGGEGGMREVGKFGTMSDVVVLRGMVDGMDLNEELGGAGDGGLLQEIGEECGEKVCECHDFFLNTTNMSIVWPSRESLH
jgi:splicing factor 45